MPSCSAAGRTFGLAPINQGYLRIDLFLACEVVRMISVPALSLFVKVDDLLALWYESAG